MAKYFSSSVLSGKRRKPPRERIDDQRYRYLGLADAEPDLGDPLVGPSSEGANPVKSGDQYIVVAVEGFPGERFWIPNQGDLIPGSISVFDETNLVGALSSITQLDFLGAGVKASTQTVKISTLNLGGNFSFSENQTVTQVGNSGVSGIVEFSTTNAGIVTLTNVNGNFNTSGALLQNGNATGVTPSSISIFNDPSIRAQIEVTPEFFSENRQFIFNDNDEFNGALNLTYNQSNGYVGVGTTAATQMLHVQGNLRLTGTVYDTENSPGVDGQLLVKANSGTDPGLKWIDQGSLQIDAAGIRGSVQYHNAVGKIGGASNFVFNDISGVNNVGIGSTLPKVDLDVVGVATFSSRVQVGNLEVIGLSVFGNDLDINASVNVSTNLDVDGLSTFNDPVIITDTTDSSNSTTGALKVAGGIGVAKTVHIGESLNLLDNKKINIGVSSDLQIYHDGTNSYIDNNTGHLYIRNNVDDDDGGNIYLQAKSGEDGIIINDDGAIELYHNGGITPKLLTNSGGVEVKGTLTADIFSGTDSQVVDITVTGTADIATADVETLNVNTGAAIANINEIDAIHTDTNTLNVGVAATIAKLTVDNIEVDGNNITATTGNLVISADGTSFVNIDKLEITDTTDFTGTNAALIVKGGADIDKKLNVDGVVTFTKDTESTSPTTGALKITGGVGIAKQLNVAGITSITNTTPSTDISTGAFKVAGGVGILGSLNIGGSVGFGSTALPLVNNQHDFGSTSKRWKNIHAEKFIGSLEGSAEKTDITADSTNTNRFIFLSDISSGSATAFGDTDLIYNPSINALGIATDRFDSAVSSTNTGKIAVGIVTAHELYGSLRGNADTATKLLNARDFSIDGGTAAGDVFATAVPFDGTANVVLDGSLRNSGVTAGTYGNKNSGGKGTAYARIEVNAKGVITSAEEILIDGGEITVDTAKNVAIAQQTSPAVTHYLHFGDVINTNLADKNTYDRVNVDSSQLAYIPSIGVGIGSTAPTTKLDVGGVTRTTRLTVTETSTFSGNVDINAGVDIQNNLIVGGATTLANNGGITTTGGDFYVGGSLFADVIDIEDAINTQSLIVTGIATINQLEIGKPDQVLVGITTILDEDDMASDSATALATQQSIKKYVDDTVDAQNDLSFSGDTGSGTVDLDSQTFNISGTPNEIETSANNQTITIGLPNSVTIADNFTVNGNTTLGSDNTNKVTFNALVNTHIIPKEPDAAYEQITQFDLGENDKRWRKVYASEVVATTITGTNFTGLAATATKLETPRTFTMGDTNDSYNAGVSDDIVSIGKTFDGTQPVGFALSLTDTGVTGGTYGDANNVAQFTVDNRGRISFAQNVVISNDRNVSTASSLESSRNIAATGDIAWNVDFKGHEDVTAAATLATVNTSAGLPGPFGSSTVIPVINVNEKGLVTAVSTQNITTVPNALTANKLTTPRTFTLGEGGDDDIISIGKTFDGTQPVGFALTLKDVGPGAGNYGGENKLISLDLDAKGRVTGVTSTAIDFSLATVATADALTVSRKIKATNDISWEVDFKGDTDVEAEATLKTITTLPSDLTAAFGSDTTIPKVKLDNKGRVIEIENVGIDFDNATVSQSDKIKVVENDNNSKHYLTFISSDSEPLPTAYYDLYGDDGLEYNPSSNLLSVRNLSVTGDASVTNNLTVSGNTTLGSVNTTVDTVTFNAKVNSSILPSHNATSETDASGLDIGAADKNFRVVYAKKFEGALLGNSNTASQLSPGAAIHLIGDVNTTMTTPFTGNGDYNITDITLTTTDVTAGEYPNQTPTGLVPTFTVDSKGRLQAAGSYTPTLPSSNLQLSGTDKAILFNNSDSVGYADGFEIDGKTLKLDTADSLSVPRIRYNGANATRIILRIDGPGNGISNNFGFDIAYMGGRSNNANSLSIFADNANSKIEAINILQNGNTGFGVIQTNGSAAEHDIPTSGGGVVTVGKLKAREIEVTGNITVINVTELAGIGFTNLGDTPSTYSGSNGRYVKVSGNELVFDTLTASDIDQTSLTNFINNDSTGYTVEQGDVTQFESNLTIGTGQIPNLTNFINNGSTGYTVEQGDVTQYEGDLTIGTDQITNLTTFINDLSTDTTYQLQATQDSAGTNNSDNTDPYLFLNASSGTDDSIQLVGSGSVSVTRNGNARITISGAASGIQNGDSAEFTSIELRRSGGSFIDWKNNDIDYDIRLSNFTEQELRLSSRSNSSLPAIFTVAGSNGLLRSEGEITADGNITAFTSDIRLKKDIEPIKNALEKVQSIRGFTYSHNETAKELGFTEERRWSGVSAQEIEKVLPEAVFPAPVDDKYLTVQYEKLVPLLIEAIKELKEEVNDLRSQIGG